MSVGEDASRLVPDVPPSLGRVKPPRRVVPRLALASVGLLLVATGVAVIGWRVVDDIRNPSVAVAAASADAIVVFGGEERRFALARELVEAGRAPVLVLGAARLPRSAASWCDERTAAFEVVCVTPTEASTHSEVAAFGGLARRRAWDQIIGVTGNYHASRANMLLERCFDGQLSWELVDWSPLSWDLIKSEALKWTGNLLQPIDC